ncbi:MAG TPA: 50S ribosomal protein L11 methyltransferase [Solirubrobacteraceae bacterium]
MIRLAVRVRREDAEVALAELLELAPGGVEEVDDTEHGVVEYAVYGAPGELPALPDLRAAAGVALVEISTREVADDWAERWKLFHRPVDVGPLRVRPPWEDARPDAAIDLVIDPGQAFGTGGHATTRFCLQLLLELAASEPARGPLLDVGTGSGVLAIAAAMLGYDPLPALDNERESLAAATENAAVNGVELQTRLYDLRTDPLPWSPAPRVVTANLLRPLLLALAEKLPAAPAHLIAGGLLEHEVEHVLEAFARAHGLRERLRLGDGQWAALWLSAA